VKRGEKGAKCPRPKISINETRAVDAVNSFDATHNATAPSHWYRCTHVVSQAQDKCTIGSWVFAKSPFSSVRVYEQCKSANIG